MTNEKALLDAAGKISLLMRELNLEDVYELVVDDARRGGSVYHHLDKALERVLQYLGTGEKSTFYDLVSQGQTPQEALATVKALEADRLSL